MNDRMIAALLRERAGYEARGLDDRVAQVDAQLAHYGHRVEETSAPDGRTADDGRTQTADAAEPRRGRGRPARARE